MEALKFGAVALSFVATLLLLLAFGRPNDVCVSKGGRFPPYSSEGKAPGKVTRVSKGLTLCRIFRGKTCCGVEQTHPALLSVRRLSLTGEASQECVNLWELLECSICDPKIGVQPGIPLICSSLCDRIYHACSDAYFSRDSKSHALAPCGPNDIICAKASHWVSNGTELCNAAGFSVMSDDDGDFSLGEKYCYGNQASLDSIHDSWQSSQTNEPEKSENKGFMDDALSRVRKTFGEIIFWAVAGMVLTAGVLIIRRRRRDRHYEKIAAILRDKKKLDTHLSKKNKRKEKGR